MSIDVAALIRALAEDPDQRAALRRAVFGEQPDLGSILASIARHVDDLAHAQARTEQRVDQLTQAVDQLAQAQARTEKRVDLLTQRLDELTKDVRALAVAQRETTESLKALIDTVRGIHDRVGKLDGDALERRYREKGHAYFAPIARRLRLLAGNDLSPLVDDAERSGRLTAAEATSILLADAVFSGRRRGDDAPLHLVVETSVTVSRHDVRRARERADLLARVTDTPAVAVVAGEFAPEPVAIAAQDADVWRVTDGRVVSPSDDLEADHPG